MIYPEPNGHDEPFIPMARRPTFRVLAAVVTLFVVLAMIAITLGPYLIDRGSRPARTTLTTTLGV